MNKYDLEASRPPTSIPTDKRDAPDHISTVIGGSNEGSNGGSNGGNDSNKTRINEPTM